MKSKLKEILGKTDDIILQYPMVLTMAIIAAVSAVVGITLDNYDNQFLITKLAFTACLGISLMFGIKMLSQRIGNGFIMEIVGTIFLFGFYFYLPKSEKDFTEMYAFVLFPAFLLSHLFVSFSAFLNKNTEINFWQFNKNLFINFFLTAVFTGVLVGGVELAILAIDKLFDINFDYRIYPKTFLFLAILGSCFIFLLFSERGLPQLEKDGTYPQILKFFTQFVLIPLLLIYAVILYFYSAKILLNWELPRGWVSYLVLAYSVVGILALLLVHPLKEDSTKSWVKVFSKIFYYTLIPLLVLLFVAIFTRILEYGYTEPRYYVLILACWLTTVVLYFVFFRNSNIKFIPISLFAFGVFALLMPFMNAFSVSKRSQKTELQNILTQNNLLENGKINFTKPVQDSVAIEIADKFQYLNERKENKLLLSYIPENQQKKFKNIIEKDRYLVNSEIYMSFKNKRFSKPNAEAAQYTQGVISKKNSYDINDFEKVIFYKNPDAKNEELIDNHILRVKTIRESNYDIGYKIELESPTKVTQTYDLTPFLMRQLQADTLDEKLSPMQEISTEFDLQPYHFKVYFSEISNNRYNKTDNLFVRDMVILVKKK